VVFRPAPYWPPLNNTVIDNLKLYYKPDAKMADGLTHSYIGTIVPLMDQSPILNQMDMTVNMMKVLMYLNLHRGGRKPL
jgi:hypothetical protein